MNTWTDGGISEAALVGALLAVGVDTRSIGGFPRRDTSAPARLPYRNGHREPAAATGSGGGRYGGVGSWPSPPPMEATQPAEGYPSPSYPPIEPLVTDLTSSTDGFLADGLSASSAAAGWDIGGTIGSWSQPEPITPPATMPPPPESSPRTPASGAHQSSPMSLAASVTDLVSSSDTSPARPPAHARPAAAEPELDSYALSSLDTSGLFAALSRRNH